MKLVIGTTNPAKFQRYQTILAQFPMLELVALSDFDRVPDVVEDGLTAAENARKKALAYAAALNLPVLSVDESLCVAGFPAEEQPGVNVRRYLGHTATDEELLAAFLEKIRALPPELRWLTWTYAIHLAFPDGRAFQAQVELTQSLTTQPSLPLQPGYPLASIQLDRLTGKPLRELTPEEERTRLAQVYEAVAGLIQRAGLG